MICLRMFVCTCLVIGATASVQPLLCMRTCSNENDAACGFDGVSYRTFNSYCDLLNAECIEGIHYEYRHMMECLHQGPVTGTTPSFSDFDLNPVTAKMLPPAGRILDGMAGKLLGTMNTACEFCAPLYEPVCGFDGNSHELFLNPCELRRGNCLKSATFSQCEKSLCNTEVVFA